MPHPACRPQTRGAAPRARGRAPLPPPPRAGRAGRGLAWVLAAAAACSPAQDPPGRIADAAQAARPGPALAPPPAPPAPAGARAPRSPGDDAQSASADGADADGAAPAAPDEVGEDKEAGLPGQGAKIASIAMRTWIYVAPNDRSTKLGYLRAGAVVDRAERAAGTSTCAGGWYRIAPRGYVCVGKGASLALEHQVVAAAVRGPRRGEPAPYHYAISRSPPPHLYFRLPTRADQERVEGSTLDVHLARAGVADASIPLDPVPEFLAAGRELPKPYGADEKLHYSVHTGRAKDGSAYGLVTTFEWTGRRFGLTTELDLIPLDRTKPARLSEFRGIVIDAPPPETEGAGVEPSLRGAPAFVRSHGAKRRRREGNRFVDGGAAPFRSGWVLTGRTEGGARGLLETTEGSWLAADHLVIAELRAPPEGNARPGEKWIDVSIKRQMLVAYDGTRPAFATLVSTGRGGMGDPETTHATMRGIFRIRVKHVSTTMDGDEETAESFDLRDVPYTQYFFEGYALHGAYWHDDFGKKRSHGCINLSPADAAWLFEWTEPAVPPEWHGALNGEGGTLVHVHG